LQWYYSFRGGQAGAVPYAPLMQAADGNFYGTTTQGGVGPNPGLGVVYKLDQGGSVTVLHKFAGVPLDGQGPIAGLVQATDGNLYGVAAAGGQSNDGTAFRMTTGGTYTQLCTFSSNTGSYPAGSLMQDTSGLLYGTLRFGSPNGYGAVFSLNIGVGSFITFVQPSGKAGSTVQTLGQGLTGTTSVTFNGVAATSFKVASDTYMTAVVPSGATSGPVVVTTPSGNLTSNKSFQIQ